MKKYLDRTDGIHSRTRKLDLKQVEKIRRWYAEGKRGTKYASKINPPISPCTFNSIGAGRTWKEKT